jgi:cell division protein ZapA
MSNTLTVSLLDKEYTLSCPADAEAGLIAAAENLDSKMREIANSGKLLGMERIAVMAALNLSYDNLNSSKAEASSNDESKQLIEKIDETLAKFS